MPLMTEAAGDREGRTLAIDSSESLLLAFEREGDACAFEELVRRHSGGVLATCRQVTGNAHDAEDAVQAVFLTLALQARTRGSGSIDNVGAWLQQVARNTSLNVCRGRKRRKAREEREASDGTRSQGWVEPHPAHAVGMDELRAILRAEVNELPPKYRLPLIMHYFGGMTPQEVAGQVKCTTQTLAVRLFRGRKMLAERLARRGLAVGGVALSLAVAEVILTGLARSLAPASAQAAVPMHVTVPKPGSASASWATKITRTCISASMASRLRMACFGVGAIALVATALGQSLRGEYPLHLAREWDPRPILYQAYDHARGVIHRLWVGPGGTGQPSAPSQPSPASQAPAVDPQASRISTMEIARYVPLAGGGWKLAEERPVQLLKQPTTTDWLSSQTLAAERARTAAVNSPQFDGPVTLTGCESSSGARHAKPDAMIAPVASGAREKKEPTAVAVATGPTPSMGEGYGGYGGVITSLTDCCAWSGGTSGGVTWEPTTMAIYGGDVPHRYRTSHRPEPPVVEPEVLPYGPAIGTPEPSGVAAGVGLLMLMRRRRRLRSC